MEEHLQIFLIFAGSGAALAEKVDCALWEAQVKVVRMDAFGPEEEYSETVRRAAR